MIDPSGNLGIVGRIAVAALAITVLVSVVLLVSHIKKGIDPWELINDPRVNAEMRNAYIQSNMGAAPPLPVEQGGYIVRTSVFRKFDVVRVPTGQQAQLAFSVYPDGRINGKEIVGTFHTHPNVGPGWVQEPSPQDLQVFQNYPSTFGEFGFVISIANIYIMERVNNQTQWRIFAPTVGNVR